MIGHFENARCLFVDGPVAVSIITGSEQEILDAFDRLRRLVAVAAKSVQQQPDWTKRVDVLGQQNYHKLSPEDKLRFDEFLRWNPSPADVAAYNSLYPDRPIGRTSDDRGGSPGREGD